MAVVIDRCYGFKPFARPPRCILQSFTQLDFRKLDFGQSNRISQSELGHDFEFSNIHRSFSTPCLSQSYSRVRDDRDTKSRIEIIVGRKEPRIRALASEVSMALASGVNPEPTSNGLGGAYFLRTKNGPTIAVAKPIDEEPLAFNNPKGLAGRMLGQPGMRCSIKIGETGLRETAAYFLDHDGFAGVPPTALVRFSHVKFNSNNLGSDSAPTQKIASLQRFVKHDSDAGDMGPSSFSVTCVHHIGILDVRLMNLDRHAGNILVKPRKDGYARGTAELVPIDHGFCLPESLDDPYFEWLHWPQASIPFSETDLTYISRLDPYKDAEILRTELPSIQESSIRVLVLCTIFLKQATMSGLCLADIGTMMTREFCGGNENYSTLEMLCIKAKDSLANKLRNKDDNKFQQVGMIFEFGSVNEVDSSDEDAITQAENETFQDSPTKGKPSKIPRISTMPTWKIDTDEFAAASFSSNMNGRSLFDNVAFNALLDTLEKKDDINNNNNKRDGYDKDPKVSSIVKSQSLPAPNREGLPCISFGEMNHEEWRLFLEYFLVHTAEAIEERKSLGLTEQQRMSSSSSCQF